MYEEALNNAMYWANQAEATLHDSLPTHERAIEMANMWARVAAAAQMYDDGDTTNIEDVSVIGDAL